MPGAVDYWIGVTPLQVQEQGNVVVGKYQSVPDGALTTVVHDGSTYKIHALGSGYYLADSARALLLFSEALLTALAKYDGREAPGFHYYITDEIRDIVTVP